MLYLENCSLQIEHKIEKMNKWTERQIDGQANEKACADRQTNKQAQIVSGNDFELMFHASEQT